MTETDPKADLHHYLRSARDALLWKLDGLSEYDIRRPLTPTGTNLLGLVKHSTTVEVLYLGLAFGRPFEEPLPWFREDSEPNEDMWASAEESREDVVGRYRRACAHSDATIEALDLDTTAELAWWQDERDNASLHRLLTHVIAEAHRHVGHADLVRELIDGAVGLRPFDDDVARTTNNDVSGKALDDSAWWADHRDRLETAARKAGRA